MGEAQSKDRKDAEEVKGNGKKITTPLLIGLGVGAGALASVIAAPFVIAGIGFGAGGVAAGSIAAAWMSASGPVAAGSLIAILQSIGAAGMGAASVGVAAAAGGAVGAVGGGIAAAVINNSESNEDTASNSTKTDDSESYKSKAIKMKLIFKNLPSDEWLIADYPGALVDDLLVPGRLYLTTNHFGFHSNTAGREVTLLFNLREVLDIAKIKSGNVFRLTTETGTRKFANYEDCDASNELIDSIWRNSRNSKVSSPDELLKIITDIYGMNLGFRDTEETTAFFFPFPIFEPNIFIAR